MNFISQLHAVIADGKTSLGLFAPELVLCATIVALLLVRCIFGRRVEAFYVALAGTVVALVAAAPWYHLADGRQELFTGMLVYDGFGVFVRAALLLFGVLFVVFTKLSGIPDREDGPDMYTLVLGATLGMCLMATANHLFMAFVAVEMASVPSYALAGLLKGRRQSSEAALKYSVYGAGTAGIMLYGISLIVGLTNTAHIPSIAASLAQQLPHMPASEVTVLALGGLMLAVGLAFKLSAVPFHFWCPDVFEGAAAEVNAFLSVASKAAALALLVRVAVGFGVVPSSVKTETAPKVAATESNISPALYSVASEPKANSEATTPAAAPAAPNDALKHIREFVAKFIALVAIITCTFGNLSAYGQHNIKRLLAYSTIAHAGYMMMPLPAALELASAGDLVGARSAIAALGIYIGVYLFMNLGAFVVVAFLRNALRSEEISAYAGLIKRLPVVTVCFALMLFSLIGLPPLSGFIGKFAVFAAITEAWKATGQGYLMVLLVAGGLNTAISLAYYLRVIKTMTIDPEPADRVPFAFSDVSLPGAFVWAVTLPTILLFVFWSWLGDWALAAASSLFV